MTASKVLFYSALLVLMCSICSTRAEEDFTKKQQPRQLQDNPYVYSKQSVLDPDPLLVDNNDDDKKAALKEKFGYWHFWDGTEAQRPTVDYCGQHKYRDINSDQYPDTAWQKDAVFINHILDDGEKMVSRAMEAIFSDYGRGKPLPPEAFKQRTEMFQMIKLDLTTQTALPEDYETGFGQRGGWTTQTSYKGLVRRLLHAMMSNDEFVVVLGGDAAAAGHGNHFRQAYLMQFHRILSPMLARMGVKLVTRNMAMGHGLGTVQSSLGFSSLFGQDIDLLIWDGAMTESDAKYVDLFFRQGLLSSGPQGKIPYLMIGGNSNNMDGLFDLMRWFHNEAGADVGQLGTALYGVPVTESKEQAETNITRAFQYLNCKPEEHKLCNEHKYCTKCWLDRTDVTNPNELFPLLELDKAETTNPTSVAWYPGWRQHQLLGRTLAYTLVDAMQDAVEQWMSDSFNGPPLAESKWHVTEMYDTMRTKLTTALASSTVVVGNLCYELAKETKLPERTCRIRMKGATHHTPRLHGTTIAELVVVTRDEDEDSSLVPTNPKKVLYDGQDVHNECMDAGNVDVVQILNLRRRRRLGATLSDKDDAFSEWQFMPPVFERIHQARILSHEESKHRLLGDDDAGDDGAKDDATGDAKDDATGDAKDDATGDAKDDAKEDAKEEVKDDAKEDAKEEVKEDVKDDAKDGSITLGKGWSIHGEKPGACNGEYLSICGRDSSDNCPLLGYHDSGGAIVGTDACGWLVLDIPRVEHGILILKYAFYGGSNDNDQAQPNEKSNLRARRLNSGIPDNENFRFEFAIDGQVTSWNKAELLDHTRTVHRRMETTTLLDNADFTKEAKTVRLGIRIKECGKSCVFALSHVYWA